MKIYKLIPEFAKPILRPIYNNIYWHYQNTIHKQKSVEELHRYWNKPDDNVNLPEEYIDGEAKSKYLIERIKKYASAGNILEIGCNIGRNLNYLLNAGYTDLTGVEISEDALLMMGKYYPRLVSQASIIKSPIEDVIKSFKNKEFDVIYTMAVLQHIHKDSEWIFKEMVRITKGYIITIEDERKFISWRHFPRNYKKVFEHLGMKQVEEYILGGDLKLDGDMARVFVRK